MLGRASRRRSHQHRAPVKLLLPPEKAASAESWEGREKGWSDVTLL